MLDPGSNKFIIPDISVEANTFEVEIKRNGLGLGFSITGGDKLSLQNEPNIKH